MTATASPQPDDRPPNQTDNLGAVIIVIDGPVDKTRRPRRPSAPYFPPPPPEPDDTPPDASNL